MAIHSLKAYPILRLTIPLAAGVFFAGTFPCLFPMGVYVAGILLLALALGRMAFGKNYEYRWMFGAGVFLLFFLLGGLRMAYQWQQVNQVWPEEERTYQGVVQEIPEEKAKTIQCKTMLSDGQNVIFYLAKDSLAHTVSMGDRLWVQARIRPPMNTGFTGDFDYASYLLHKGVGGTSYVLSGSWMKSKQPAMLTWKQRALEIRQRIVSWYREWGIGEEQLPVLSALTIGHKEDLSDEIREAYSVAGIAHVLTLSGMNVGFLWMLISLLLKPLEASKPLRWVKWGLSTGLLWAFAFIAGLEASIVRAVIMCMLMEMGRMAGGKTLSMNTLAVAALFMLLYNPFYLFDVSFQLSFLAVLAILLVYPSLQRKCPTENRWLRGVWGILSVSVAAQIGTAPLVMYCFSNFSVYFLLANLGVSLWVPFIIYTALGTMVCSFIPPIQEWGIALLDKQVELLNAFASWISAWPGASAVSFPLGKVDVWGIYLLMMAVMWYAFTRKRKAVIVIFAITTGWLGLHCYLLF